MHDRSLVTFLNGFADISQPLPRGWEQKLISLARYITFKILLNTYIYITYKLYLPVNVNHKNS